MERWRGGGASALVVVLPQRGGIQFGGVNIDGGQSGGDGELPDHGDHCDHHREVWQSRAQQTDVSKWWGNFLTGAAAAAEVLSVMAERNTSWDM